VAISQRILATSLIAIAISVVCGFRMVYVYPGRPIPLTEVVGALGALSLSVPFVWMKRFTTLRGSAAVVVPCMSWGVIAFILWMTGERTLALLTSFLFVWYAYDWIIVARNSEKQRVDDKSERQNRNQSNGGGPKAGE
jgi:hypothetical protein